MSFLLRFRSLLFEPDYATSDLYDNPRVWEGFLITSAYALVSSLHAVLGAILTTGSLSLSMLTFITSLFLVYVFWVALALVFRFAADLMGGLGEIPHALSFVGMAAAPNAVMSALGILVTVGGAFALPDDPELVIKKINLGLALIGMGWGLPGALCYFGLKHGERLRPAKAIPLTLVVFFFFAILELINTSAF